MAALRALSARLASLAPAASGAERAAALGWAARGYTSPPRVPLVPEIMPSMEELLRGSGEDEDDSPQGSVKTASAMMDGPPPEADEVATNVEVSHSDADGEENADVRRRHRT